MMRGAPLFEEQAAIAATHEQTRQFLPQERDECDICMLTLPIAAEEQRYQSCCGKMLCMGCIHAAYIADNRKLCPFCRTPEATSDGEALERIKKRAEVGDDAVAIHQLGNYYSDGRNGLPQDHEKAMELWLRAGRLGYAMSYYNIALAYQQGLGVERDIETAKHYYERAAMGGDVIARNNLGVIEGNAGNIDRAMKHWMISAGAGDGDSLKNIRECFMRGEATKDNFEKALRAHQGAKDEMRSDQREAAATAYAHPAARGQY